MDYSPRKQDVKEVDFNDLMILVGFGKGHYFAMLASGFLVMYVLCETMGMSIVAPGSACDLESSEFMKSGIQAAGFLGIITAAYFWGYESDVRGRRFVLLRATSTSIVISWVSMLMTNYWVFVIFRYIMGLFLAGPSFAAMTYFGEFCTHKNRAVLINYMSTFTGFGMMYCPVLGELWMFGDWYIHVAGDLELRPWRLLGFCLTIPGVISVLLLLKLPESPKFLLAWGRGTEALEAANYMCHLNTGKDLFDDMKVSRVKPLPARPSVAGTNIRHSMARQMLNDGNALFKEPFLNRFILSCTVMFGLMLVTNGFGIWFTEMRNRADLVAAYEDTKYYKRPTVCRTLTDYSYPDVEPDLFICNDSFKGFADSIRLGLTFIVEYQILGFALFYYKRKPIFVISLCVCGCAGLCLMFVTHPQLIRISFLLFLSIPGVIMSLLGGAVLEFIPTYLRGKGMCICLMVGRSGAVVGMLVLGTFMETHCLLAFFFFSMVPFICAGLGYMLPLDAHLF